MTIQATGYSIMSLEEIKQRWQRWCQRNNTVVNTDKFNRKTHVRFNHHAGSPVGVPVTVEVCATETFFQTREGGFYMLHEDSGSAASLRRDEP